jgi:antitoxin component YwqK of YwqJK toxin-antitoxin module
MKFVKGSLVIAMTLFGANEVRIELPKEITKEWEAKVFGIKDGVQTLCESITEMVQGSIEGVFDTSFLSNIEKEVKNNPTGEGVYVEYWPNGNLKANIPYKNGKAHGHVHGWHEDGTDAFKGHFNEGVKQGVHITFYKVTEKESNKMAHVFKYNEKGELDGDEETFHRTGRLFVVLPYKNGKAHGPLECWNIDREQYICVNYKNGLLQKTPPPPPERRKRAKQSMASKYVNQVRKRFIKIAQKEYGVMCTAEGSSLPYDVENISLYFAIKSKGTIEEGRELFIKLKERFINEINQDEKLRPYLREYPFTQDRATILLSYCDKKGNDYTDGSVTLILSKGKKEVCYLRYVEKDSESDELLVEPYEEALKIVQNKNKELSLKGSKGL